MTTTAELRNKYQEKMDTDALRQKGLAKKLGEQTRLAREYAQKMMIGDDAKVGEAVIMSFFASVYGDIATAFRAYKEQRLKDELERTKESIEKTAERIKTLKEAEDKTRKINEFTRLNIQKAALEQKMSGETLSSSERASAEKSLGDIIKKIEKTADYFEKSPEFLKKAVEKTEKDWFGNSAELLKEMRSLTPDFKEKVLSAVTKDELINSDALVERLVKEVSSSIIENDLVEATMKELASKALKATPSELIS